MELASEPPRQDAGRATPNRFSDARALGFSVFPVQARSKLPVGEWKRYQTRSASYEQAEAWDGSAFNVGIATGDVSGIFVLDLDNPEAEAEAQQLGFVRDDTACVKTGKGRHYYYRTPPDLRVTNKAALGGVVGIDIRGNGGFVVGPGSAHPTGHLYAWEKHPLDVPIADAPEPLLTQLRSCRRGPRTASNGSARHPDDDPELATLEAQLRDAQEGERNDRLNASAYRLGQLVAAARAEREEWEPRLRAAAQACGLPDVEIDRTMASAIEAGSANPRQADTGVRLADFYAFMPSHNYIFQPSGETWPSSSVNSRIAPVQVGDERRIPANQWLDQHRAVEQMTWAPGEPKVIRDRLISDGGWIGRPGCNVFNLYRGPSPTPGDSRKAGPWLDHVESVYPTDADHLIKWLAHRVQRPNEKINHALFMGGAQGIGKDTILEPVKAAIGPWNFAEIAPHQLLGRFNGFAKSIILRVSEACDLGDVDRFAFYDHTKTYTASPPDVLRVDEKNLREYYVFNVTGMIVTSNYKGDGLYLPEDDRRHYVAWSERTKDEFTPEYWQKLWGWYRNGGIGHVAAYLAELDISGFDPKAPPPKTEAFFDIVASNCAPEAAELTDALEKLGWRDAVTLGAVVEAADADFGQWLKDRKNSRRVPHKMEECGYRSVRNPGAVKSGGRWKVNGKDVVIYVRRQLSVRDGISAAEKLARDGEHVPL
jgi:hypothetical protein